MREPAALSVFIACKETKAMLAGRDRVSVLMRIRVCWPVNNRVVGVKDRGIMCR